MPHPLSQIEKRHLWHPFTPMQDWCSPQHEPLFIIAGCGCELIDSEGRRYLDGNSSIWTNLHGHAHPTLTRAIQQQAEKIAHSSFLGLTHPLAAQLALELVQLFQPSPLQRVFFSDNGSTAIEVAVRMALQFWNQNGQPHRTHLAAFDRAYHGDTLGAVSLGGIAAFRGVSAQVGYPVHHLRTLDDLKNLPPEQIHQLAAVVIEPLIQGAAGMRLWPVGMLKELEQWCHQQDIFLILDEVMTGFGRTGTLFACQQETVSPDFIALAKGLTGGTLPLAATLTTQRVFDGFLGRPDEGRTFYYGHSYTANPLGCAAALANLQIFRDEQTLAHLPEKIEALRHAIAPFYVLPWVSEVRQCGLIVGIDLVAKRDPLTPFPPERFIGAQVCRQARHHGLLTRPVLDTLVLMPPLAATIDQIQSMTAALLRATEDVCGDP